MSVRHWHASQASRQCTRRCRMSLTDTQILVLIAIAVLIAAGIAVVVYQRQSRRLHERFGPEYDRTVQELGSKTKAEAELRAREKRVNKLHIVRLSSADVTHFSQQWRDVQGRFVDNPQRAVVLADRLVKELMNKRGYPMGDFERRAADISVDHPIVVDNYRAAQSIVTRNDKDTEMLRRALVHYRALFDDLLEVNTDKRAAITPMQEIRT